MPKSPSSQMKILSIIEQRTKRRDSLACLRRGSHLKPLPPLYTSATSLQHPNAYRHIQVKYIKSIKLEQILSLLWIFLRLHSLFPNETIICWQHITVKHKIQQNTSPHNKSAPHNASHWFRNQRQLSADCLSLGVQPEASGCAVLCCTVQGCANRTNLLVAI